MPSFTSKAALLALAAQSSTATIIAYWGDGGYNPPDGNLAQWCADNLHIDILNLSFLENYGSGVYPNGNIGSCTVNDDGSSDGCEQLEADIGTCQSMGKKVFMSLNQAGGNGALNSINDGKGVAYSLWNSYGSPDAVTDMSKRPFGNARLDGFDIDIEVDPNNEDQNGYLGAMINQLRQYFETDPNNTYYISGAPQCYLNGDQNMDVNIGNSINQAQYDYLSIQFYNNECAAVHAYDGSNLFNLADWPGVIANGASANAKLLVGLPGNPAEAGSDQFVPIDHLADVYEASKNVAGFDGFMVFEVGDTTTVSDVNGCDYFASLYSVLTTGHTC